MMRQCARDKQCTRAAAAAAAAAANAAAAAGDTLIALCR
jgi:hypothetical protein